LFVLKELLEILSEGRKKGIGLEREERVLQVASLRERKCKEK